MHNVAFPCRLQSEAHKGPVSQRGPGWSESYQPGRRGDRGAPRQLAARLPRDSDCRRGRVAGRCGDECGRLLRDLGRDVVGKHKVRR